MYVPLSPRVNVVFNAYMQSNASTSNPTANAGKKLRLVSALDEGSSSPASGSVVPKKRLSEGLPDRIATLTSPSAPGIRRLSLMDSSRAPPKSSYADAPSPSKKLRITPLAPHDDNRTSKSPPLNRLAVVDPSVPSTSTHTIVQNGTKKPVNAPYSVPLTALKVNEGGASSLVQPAVASVKPDLGAGWPVTAALEKPITSISAPAGSNSASVPKYEYDSSEEEDGILKFLKTRLRGSSASDMSIGMPGSLHVASSEGCGCSACSYDENIYDDQGNWYGRGRDRFRGPVAQRGE